MLHDNMLFYCRVYSYVLYIVRFVPEILVVLCLLCVKLMRTVRSANAVVSCKNKIVLNNFRRKQLNAKRNFRCTSDYVRMFERLDRSSTHLNALYLPVPAAVIRQNLLLM